MVLPLVLHDDNNSGYVGNNCYITLKSICSYNDNADIVNNNDNGKGMNNDNDNLVFDSGE